MCVRVCACACVCVCACVCACACVCVKHGVVTQKHCVVRVRILIMCVRAGLLRMANGQAGAFVGAVPGPGGFNMLAKHVLGDLMKAQVGFQPRFLLLLLL